MKKIVPVLLCFIIIVASDMLVQSSEKYSASMRYDLARISTFHWGQWLIKQKGNGAGL